MFLEEIGEEQMDEPTCYIVVEVVGPTVWIEDGPFSKQEAIDLAAKHTKQMADLTGGQFRAAAVHVLPDHMAAAVDEPQQTRRTR